MDFLPQTKMIPKAANIRQSELDALRNDVREAYALADTYRSRLEAELRTKDIQIDALSRVLRNCFDEIENLKRQVAGHEQLRAQQFARARTVAHAAKETDSINIDFTSSRQASDVSFSS
jgi:predicted RNase H-like nuclease (RuvC/YqgF family)